jgi:hypothetical protein
MIRIELNPFARRFEEAFSRAFPQWSDCTYPYQKWCGPGDPMDEVFFSLPSPRQETSLDAWTWRGAVRLSFMHWYRQLREGKAPSPDAIGSSIRLIDEVVRESVVFVYRKRIFYRFDRNLFHAVVVPVESDRFERGRGFLASRSWNGTYDAGTMPEIKL